MVMDFHKFLPAVPPESFATPPHLSPDISEDDMDTSVDAQTSPRGGEVRSPNSTALIMTPWKSMQSGLADGLLPKVRELTNTCKSLPLRAKKQRSELVRGLATAVGADITNDVQDSAMLAQRERRWEEACKAVHSLHNSARDAAAITGSGIEVEPSSSSTTSKELKFHNSDSTRSGLLEVKVIDIQSAVASDPVCQFSLGTSGEFSGAVELGGEPLRFVVEEVARCDLRVHVFDRGNKSFDFGHEEFAFAGGAFVPLCRVLRLGGLAARDLSADMEVVLLPLEAIKGADKLECGFAGAGLISRPSKPLGSVRLHLRLLLGCPAVGFYVLPTFRGELLEAASIRHAATLDDPMSVLKAVASAVQRLAASLDFSTYVEAWCQLRNEVASGVLLYVLWTLAMLVLPLHAAPACCLVAVVLLVRRTTWLDAKQSVERPLKLYIEKKREPDEQSLVELGKSHLAQGFQVQIGIMRTVQRLNEVAAAVERVHYLLSKGDIHVRACALAAATLTTLQVTVALWLRLVVFRSVQLPVVSWAIGCIFLLPERGMQVFQILVDTLRELHHRLATKVLQDSLRSFWSRVPDAVEAQHLELCAQNVAIL
mmetsp:Transcript_14331/g.26315  ORF Transcript_14331/g.26315 Transcript_14331/m.26315 type:complete len:597 (-) Transcript_14331:59-1849(-)